MPAKRSAVRKIKEVLRLKFEARLNHERIAAASGISKGAVSNYDRGRGLTVKNVREGSSRQPCGNGFKHACPIVAESVTGSVTAMEDAHEAELDDGKDVGR